MKKWQKVQQTTEYFVDGIALVLATLITYLVFGKGLHRILLYTADEWKSYCFMMFLAYSAIAVGFASSIDLAKRERVMELLAVLRNCSLTYMSFAVLLLVFKNPMIDSRYLFIGSYLLFILFSCLGRYVLKRVLTNNFSNSRNATLVGVVATPDRAEQFVQSLQEDWTKRVDGVTILHADAFAATASVGNPGAYRAMHSRTVEKRCCGVAVLPDLSSFLSWVRLSSIDEVYINFSGKKANWSTENLNAFIEELEDMGVLVHINIPTLEQFVEESKFNHMRCDIVAGYPMVGVSAAVQNSKMLGLKRFIDIIGAIVGLIVSAPIILLVAVPLLLESRGGLFFKQQRVGRNGRLFYMYKLRSMYADAEQRKKEFEEKNHMQGLMFKMDYDPRIIGSEKKDKNGNPKPISEQQAEDKKIIGNGLPKHLLSWDNSFTFKNFDLGITMRGAFDYDILNYPRMFYECPVNLTRGNLLATAYEPKYGKTVLNDQQELQYVSYFIERGNFWKIDNITIGYTLKLKNDYLKKIRIYATGNNLFTFTGYSGLDPEVNTQGLNPGCDELGRYPSTRSFTLGAMFTF